MRRNIFGAKVINKIEDLCWNNKEFAVIAGIKEIDKLLDFSIKLKKTFREINISLMAKFNPSQASLPQNIFKTIVFRNEGNSGILWKIKRDFSLIKDLRKSRFDIVTIFYEKTLKDRNIYGELGGALSNSKLLIGIDGNGQLYLLKNKFFIYKFFYYLLYKFSPFIIKLIILLPLLSILLLFVAIFWFIIFFLMFISDKILHYERIS